MGAGNIKGMREALNKVGNAAAWIAENCNDQQTAKYMNDMIAIVQTALSAPPINCEVGGFNEQQRRFDHWCHQHPECEGCIIAEIKKRGDSCELIWAQMKYEAQATPEKGDEE